jgi:hypothetical protein
MVNVGKIIGDNIQRIQQAEYLAREQKRQDKLLLESGAIDRTNAFESQSLDLRKKETSIDNMNEVASMMVDKYYENEKNYAGKRIDADEYRRIRQNLWNNLNQYQAFQKNTVTTITNYKKDSEDDNVSQSSKGLQKKKRIEAFKARKATIVAGDDGKAMIKIYVPNVVDGKEVTEAFEKPLEEYVSNPDLLSYDKKADLKTMTKTMAELAKSNLHGSNSYDVVRSGNMELYFYKKDEAKKILTEDDDLNSFVSANLESIVEDYMDDEKVFIPDTPETHDAYIKQLEEAKDWYAEHVYNQGLGRQVGRKTIPQPKSSKLPRAATPKTDVYTSVSQAKALENWDGSQSQLTTIDPSLRLIGNVASGTVFQNGKPILKFEPNQNLNESIRRLNIKLGYIKEAPVKIIK